MSDKLTSPPDLDIDRLNVRCLVAPVGIDVQRSNPPSHVLAISVILLSKIPSQTRFFDEYDKNIESCEDKDTINRQFK